MAQFKSIKEAFEKGYKIYALDYDFNHNEWWLYMQNNKKGMSLVFIRKKLPKYLHPIHFEKKISETDEYVWIKVEMTIKK